MNDTIIEKLLNKVIKKVYINTSHNGLKFEFFDAPSVQIYTEGDCCASYFINHINNSSCLASATILDINDQTKSSFTGDIDDNDGEVIEEFKFTLKTTKGYVDIETRLEHNGYYGGHWVEEYWENEKFYEIWKELKDF